MKYHSLVSSKNLLPTRQKIACALPGRVAPPTDGAAVLRKENSVCFSLSVVTADAVDEKQRFLQYVRRVKDRRAQSCYCLPPPSSVLRIKHFA